MWAKTFAPTAKVRADIEAAAEELGWSWSVMNKTWVDMGAPAEIKTIMARTKDPEMNEPADTGLVILQLASNLRLKIRGDDEAAETKSPPKPKRSHKESVAHGQPAEAAGLDVRAMDRALKTAASWEEGNELTKNDESLRAFHAFVLYQLLLELDADETLKACRSRLLQCAWHDTHTGATHPKYGDRLGADKPDFTLCALGLPVAFWELKKVLSLLSQSSSGKFAAYLYLGLQASLTTPPPPPSPPFSPFSPSCRAGQEVCPAAHRRDARQRGTRALPADAWRPAAPALRRQVRAPPRV